MKSDTSLGGWSEWSQQSTPWSTESYWEGQRQNYWEGWSGAEPQFKQECVVLIQAGAGNPSYGNSTSYGGCDGFDGVYGTLTGGGSCNDPIP